MSQILLLEDNPEASEAITAMLEALGHTVASASDGASGMVMLKEAPVDLVLTDIMMPVMDGISVLIEMRRSHPAIPVIAMTARRDSNYLRTAELLGAAATLFKPFSLRELGERVAGVVKPLSKNQSGP
jgi:CheY-like chemotaxis protein